MKTGEIGSQGDEDLGNTLVLRILFPGLHFRHPPSPARIVQDSVYDDLFLPT